TTAFTFTVTLSQPNTQTITVNYATANGTATTADSDYVAASGTVTFLPGQIRQTVTVTVNGDTKFEQVETFYVNLSNPTNATVSVVGDKKVEPDATFFVNLTGATNAMLPPGSKGTGTIQNDDHAPVAVPDSYSTNEDTTVSVPPPGVLANDTDADGDALTAVLVTGPMHGTLTLNANGSFTYT